MNLVEMFGDPEQYRQEQNAKYAAFMKSINDLTVHVSDRGIRLYFLTYKTGDKEMFWSKATDSGYKGDLRNMEGELIPDDEATLIRSLEDHNEALTEFLEFSNKLQ